MSNDEQKSQAVEETRFVDPNSGAAPQPGGFVAGAVPQSAESESSEPKAKTEAKSEAKAEESDAKSESKGKAAKKA